MQGTACPYEKEDLLRWHRHVRGFLVGKTSSAQVEVAVLTYETLIGGCGKAEVACDTAWLLVRGGMDDAVARALTRASAGRLRVRSESPADGKSS